MAKIKEDFDEPADSTHPETPADLLELHEVLEYEAQIAAGGGK